MYLLTQLSAKAWFRLNMLRRLEARLCELEPRFLSEVQVEKLTPRHHTLLWAGGCMTILCPAQTISISRKICPQVTMLCLITCQTTPTEKTKRCLYTTRFRLLVSRLPGTKMYLWFCWYWLSPHRAEETRRGAEQVGRSTAQSNKTGWGPEDSGQD